MLESGLKANGLEPVTNPRGHFRRYQGQLGDDFGEGPSLYLGQDLRYPPCISHILLYTVTVLICIIYTSSLQDFYKAYGTISKGPSHQIDD